MKVLFIVPGSGDSFYCGNCFRDNLQANALRKAGHEVVVMPLYLPFKYPSFKADTPLFFPATTFYAAQKFSRKGSLPKWMEHILGSNAMLNVASSFSGTTSAAGLEGITLSMINGDDAVFEKQVTEMIDWMERHEKPNIIHLSSTLLIGIAKAVKRRMRIPIVCSLQDEEVWIDSMKGDYVHEGWEGIAANLANIDRFVTTSEYYRKVITSRMPQIKDVEVIYPGVDTGKYASEGYPEKPTIGFFYRMTRENGLGILAEAFVKLKKRNTVKDLQLKVAGGYTAKDKPFLRQIGKMLQPWMHDVELCRTYDPEHHADFYKQITIISVPVTFDEGVGLYLCEAFAAGRPAAEPATGSFPEITGDAGIVYTPNTSDALADAIEKLLTDGALLGRCRENALRLSQERYHDLVMAKRLEEVYERLALK